MKTTMISVLILAGMITVPGYAADYYVSSIRSGRSDANAGTSSTAPWASFEKVISMWGNLNAGDTVHVERGSQWDLSFSSDYFNITKGGSTSGHITLRGDDYGTGNKPILRRTGGSGDCAFITIKRSYVTVRDLELDGGHSNYGKNTGGMLIIADGSNLSNAQILNMKIRNLGGNSTAYVCGIWVASFSANTISDCLIDGNEVSDYSAHGLNHYSPGPKINIIWRNNIVKNSFTGGRYPSANSAFQIGTYNSGCVFEYNWLQDTTTTEGCILGFGKYAHDFGTNIIRFNIVANSSTYGILYTIDHSNIRLNYDIYGNIFINNARSGIGILPYNSYASGTTLKIYNNIFYNNCTAGGDETRGSMELDAYCANTAVDFANNLIYHRSYGNSVGLAVDYGFNGSFSHRNNLYWHEGGTGQNIITHNQTYTVANARNYESTAQNTNPLFKNTSQPPVSVNYATGPVPDGLSLQPASPAIGNGANLGSTYALDINRVVRTVPWTIGAYQTGSAPSTDTTAPTVSITAPVNGATVSGSSVTVSATASDNIGVAGVQFKLAGANLGAEDTASPFSMVWNTTGTANGSHSLTAVARDAAGNVKTSAVVAVTVTNVPLPADAIISQIETWQTQSVALQSGTFSAEFDAVPSAANIDGLIGLSLGVTTDYEDLAVIVRFNNVGQIDVRNGDTYAADSLVSYAPGINCHFRMLVNVPAHTYSVYVQVGTNPEILLAGNYAFRTSQSAVTGLDTFGVISVAGSFMASGFSASATIPADTTAPTVSVTAPAGGAMVSGSSVTVSASASDNVGVAGVQFKLDGANLGIEDTASPFSTVWNTTAASSGSHSLTAVARDAAGNSRTSAVIAVTVSNAPPADITPPTVSVTVPAGGAMVSGSSVTVSASASDNVGVAGVQFKLAGANLGIEDTVSPFSTVWNTTAASGGSHSLTAVARDVAGNSRTSSVVTVTVSNAPPADTTQPTVAITAPIGGAMVSGNSVAISASASDNVGVTGVQFKLAGANLGTEDTVSPFSIVWDTTAASNGSNSLTAVARDAAGNSRTSSVVAVTVDNIQLPDDAIISETNTWQNLSFPAETGLFIVEFEAIPQNDTIDCISGLSQGNAAAYDDLAAIVRFNDLGQIDVRNGETYTAGTLITYAVDVSYRFRLMVNIPAHTYSVYLKIDNAPEILLAENYAFRTSQNTVSSLDTFAVTAEAGSHIVFNFSKTRIEIQIPMPPTGLRIIEN